MRGVIDLEIIVKGRRAYGGTTAVVWVGFVGQLQRQKQARKRPRTVTLCFCTSSQNLRRSNFSITTTGILLSTER